MNTQMKFVSVLALTAAIVSTMAAPPIDAPSKATELEPRQRDTNLGIGIPFIFGMDLNRQRNTTQQGNSSATAIDLGVLGGLVRFTMDRTRDKNGNRQGPINVMIFGQKVAGRR